MKFTVSTKPLSDALSLGIIDANVTKYYKQSCIATVSAIQNTLKINLETACVVTELVLKGKGEYAEGESSDSRHQCIVDSKLLKQIVLTLDSTTVTLEFVPNGLIIHSGRSKITLPNLVDEDIALKSPEQISSSATSTPVDKSDWKFIKDHQMYALAISFVHPVYTRVWLGENGDVLTGNFDESMFTHSTKSNFGVTCLIQDTIINLFNSLPEGAQLIDNGSSSRLIVCKTDAFEMHTEFKPLFEDDQNIGSYNSEIFLNMMENKEEYFKVNVSAVIKFLNQASLLSTKLSDDTVKISVADNKLTLKHSSIDCIIDIEGDSTAPFGLELKLEKAQKVFASYDSDVVCVGPIRDGDDLTGILVWDDDLETILGGVD